MERERQRATERIESERKKGAETVRILAIE